MADQTFRAIITVIDRVTAPLRAINSKITALARPVRAVGMSLSELGAASGLPKLAAAAGDAAARVRGLGSHLLGLLGPLSALAGAATLGGLAELVHKTSEYGAALYDAAIKTGVAAQRLAELHYIASITGTDAEALDRGLTRLNRTIGDALGGKNVEALSLFHRLGISLRDASGHARNAGEVMPQLAAAFDKNTSAVLRAQMAAVLFGAKSGSALIPMLARGRDEMEKMSAQADRLGLGLEDGGKSAKAFEDSQRNLGFAVQGLSLAIGSKLFPLLAPLVDGMTEWIVANREIIATRIGEFAQRLGDWLRSIDWASIAAGAAGLASAIGSVVAYMGPMKAGLLGLAIVFQPIVIGVAGLVAGLLNLAAVMLVTPVGWLVGALALIGFAAFELWRNWDSVWKGIVAAATWAWEKIAPIVEAVRAGMSFVGNAAAAGLGLGPMAPLAAATASMSLPAPNIVMPAIANDNAAAPLRATGTTGMAPLSGQLYGPQGAAAQAQPARGSIEATVRFENMPPGTRVETRGGGIVAEPETDVGYAWAPGT